MKSFKEIRKEIISAFELTTDTIIGTIDCKHIQYNVSLLNALDEVQVFKSNEIVVPIRLYLRVYEALVRYNHTNSTPSTSVMVKGFAEYLHNKNIILTMMLDVLYRKYKLTKKVGLAYDTGRSAFYVFSSVENDVIRVEGGTSIPHFKAETDSFVLSLIKEDHIAAVYNLSYKDRILKNDIVVARHNNKLENRDVFEFAKSDIVALIWGELQ